LSAKGALTKADDAVVGPDLLAQFGGIIFIRIMFPLRIVSILDKMNKLEIMPWN